LLTHFFCSTPRISASLAVQEPFIFNNWFVK
jgi:hypothetical protein